MGKTATARRVDVDKLAARLAAHAGRPAPTAPSLRELGNLLAAGAFEGPLPDEFRPLRKFGCAAHAAANGGGATFTAEPIGPSWRDNRGGADWETSRRVRLVIDQPVPDAPWTHQHSYRMVAVATATMTDRGDVSVYGGRGCASVQTDGHDVGTLFGGQAVGRAIAGLYFGSSMSHLRRRAVEDLLDDVDIDPARAIVGLAQIMSLGLVTGDVEGAMALAKYLAGDYVDRSDTTDVVVLDAVVSRMGDNDVSSPVHEAYAAWKRDQNAYLGDLLAKAVDGPPHPGYDDLGEVLRDAVWDAIPDERTAA